MKETIVKLIKWAFIIYVFYVIITTLSGCSSDYQAYKLKYPAGTVKIQRLEKGYTVGDTIYIGPMKLIVIQIISKD